MLKKLKAYWKTNKIQIISFFLGLLGAGGGTVAVNEYYTTEQQIVFGATPEEPHKTWTVEVSVDVRRTTIDAPALTAQDYYDRQTFYFEIEGDRYPGKKKALQAWKVAHEYELKTGVVDDPRVEKIYPFVNYEKNWE